MQTEGEMHATQAGNFIVTFCMHLLATFELKLQFKSLGCSSFFNLYFKLKENET